MSKRKYKNERIEIQSKKHPQRKQGSPHGPPKFGIQQRLSSFPRIHSLQVSSSIAAVSSIPTDFIVGLSGTAHDPRNPSDSLNIMSQTLIGPLNQPMQTQIRPCKSMYPRRKP